MGVSALVGLSADDFTLYPAAQLLQQQVYLNAQVGINPPGIWADLYNVIYQTNSAISGISSSSAISTDTKQQLLGECEVMRAFCYFYLVNLYGDVPLILAPDYQTSEKFSRTASTEVYRQIIIDLVNAKSSLSQNYLTPGGAVTSERVRPNVAVATALLARVYLYIGSYDSAEIEATAVINNTQFSLVQDLDSAYLASNSEAIWQLESIDNGLNAPDGAAFLLNQVGGPSTSFPYILSDSLEYEFEPGDLRAVHWTDSMTVGAAVYYFPYKYKQYYTGQPPTEYPTLLRLAEQYLIRAEARAQEGKLTGTNSAQADLNVVRNRAGLPNTMASTAADLEAAILRERRFELFTEYGHRWLDLKRTQNVDAVMSVAAALKGGNWTNTDSLYPIPTIDIQADGNLVQNPGYN